MEFEQNSKTKFFLPELAEQTEWNYTEFLNDWDRFKMV